METSICTTAANINTGTPKTRQLSKKRSRRSGKTASIFRCGFRRRWCTLVIASTTRAFSDCRIESARPSLRSLELGKCCQSKRGSERNLEGHVVLYQRLDICFFESALQIRIWNNMDAARFKPLFLLAASRLMSASETGN